MKKIYFVVLTLFLFLHINISADEPLNKIRIYDPLFPSVEESANNNISDTKPATEDKNYLNLDGSLNNIFVLIRKVVIIISISLLMLYIPKIISSEGINLIKNIVISYVLCIYNYLMIIKYSSVIAFIKTNSLFNIFKLPSNSKYITISLMALFIILLILITIKSFVFLRKDKKQFTINSYMLLIVSFSTIIFASANSIL